MNAKARAKRRGEVNSSITRVRPVFQRLLARDPTGSTWMPSLLGLATRSEARAKEMVRNPGSISDHLVRKRPYKDKILKQEYGLDEIPLEHCFEYPCAPPTRFLDWAIRNPDELDWKNKGFGKDPETIRRRQALFGIRGSKEDAQAEGLRLLKTKGAVLSRKRWWAFEGFTEVDCLLETEHLLLFIEGKRTEPLSPATMWFKRRSQLIRNLEVCLEMAKEKPCGVLLVDEVGENPYTDEALRAGLPHLKREAELARVQSVFLGHTTWRRVCEATGLDFKSLPATTAEWVDAWNKGRA